MVEGAPAGDNDDNEDKREEKPSDGSSHHDKQGEAICKWTVSKEYNLRKLIPMGLRLTVVDARPSALVTVQVYSPNCWSVRAVTSRLLLTIGPCWVSSTE